MTLKWIIKPFFATIKTKNLFKKSTNLTTPKKWLKINQEGAVLIYLGHTHTLWTSNSPKSQRASFFNLIQHPGDQCERETDTKRERYREKIGE